MRPLCTSCQLCLPSSTSSELPLGQEEVFCLRCCFNVKEGRELSEAVKKVCVCHLNHIVRKTCIQGEDFRMLNPLVTNGFSHPYHLGVSTSILRGNRSIFSSPEPKAHR